MTPSEIKNVLTYCYSTKDNDEVISKKNYNTTVFMNIDRSNLHRDYHQRRILLYQTKLNEKIYMRYPGKESIDSHGNVKRPLDFRPELQLADGTFLFNMSFKHIWTIVEKIATMKGEQASQRLASIFFLMGKMAKYKLSSASNLHDTYDITINNGIETISQIDSTEFDFYKISFDSDLYETLDYDDCCSVSEDLSDTSSEQCMSFEAFLYYFDILLQQEDCKYKYLYYHSSTYHAPNSYKYNNGRGNTCSTCISMLAYLQRSASIISLAQLLDSFKQGGIAVFPDKRLCEVTGGLISKKRPIPKTKCQKVYPFFALANYSYVEELIRDGYITVLQNLISVGMPKSMTYYKQLYVIIYSLNRQADINLTELQSLLNTLE